MREIGREFVERTKFQHLGASAQQRGLPQPALELICEREGSIIRLTPQEELDLNPFDLSRAIRERRSLRRYSDRSLGLEELSYLLWATQGVQRIVPGSATFRTVPSAGARHALETVLLANRVEGLEPGLYRYLALEHELLELPSDPGTAERISAACLDQEFVRTGAVSFFWIAVAERMTWRYGQRGYRYLYLDAGHACQNLYLAAEAVGCGTCAVGAFDDDRLNRVLGLDGEELFVIYLAAVGKK